MRKTEVNARGRYLVKSLHPKIQAQSEQQIQPAPFDRTKIQNATKGPSPRIMVKTPSLKVVTPASQKVVSQPVAQQSPQVLEFRSAPKLAHSRSPPTASAPIDQHIPPLLYPPVSEQIIPLALSPQKPLSQEPSVYERVIPASPLSSAPSATHAWEEKHDLSSLAVPERGSSRKSCDELRRRAHSAREQLALHLVRLEGEMSSMHTRINSLSTRSESCVVIQGNPREVEVNWKRMSVPALPMLHSVHVVREETHEGAAAVDYVKEAEMLVQLLIKNKSNKNNSTCSNNSLVETIDS
eukprot:c4625_g1_i1.p1 GENE.c4625_g1_i1~~c4625_g1_i1.p1  ORF type:complete len:296 (-),score=45.80 c4625_g1_i1:277-1164(-)